MRVVETLQLVQAALAVGTGGVEEVKYVGASCERRGRDGTAVGGCQLEGGDSVAYVDEGYGSVVTVVDAGGEK